MLNSAGSVGAEWYVEAAWHYLAKRALLQGVSGLDVDFKHPATVADRHVHFSLPRPSENDWVMTFSVTRSSEDTRGKTLVPVAEITIHRAKRRQLAAHVPDPPSHPYGIEVRERHLNRARQVSWFTLVTSIMDVARRGAQFADTAVYERVDPTLLYVVPRFSFVPLADAAAQPNLFVYPQFEVAQPWVPGRSSMTARVTMWAVAYEDPWPLASTLVTVVRTSQDQGLRRPIDEHGVPVRRGPRV